MIPVQNYGLHLYQGNTWLVQSARNNESAVGLPPAPLFSATLPVHPRTLAICPHNYDLGEIEPSSKEFYEFMQYVNETPVLRFLLPRTHAEQVMPLLAVDYGNLNIVTLNLERLLRMHPAIEPFTFPMQHFEQANRPLSIEAARTNLLPLIVTGFTPAHMRRLNRYANELMMTPRTVIIVCPLRTFGPRPFKLVEPGCLATGEFLNFLEKVNVRRVGTHYLRRFMRGEI